MIAQQRPVPTSMSAKKPPAAIAAAPAPQRSVDETNAIALDNFFGLLRQDLAAPLARVGDA